MEYLRLWGILSFITGIALLFHTIRKRKSIGLILYVTYLIFAITCVCLGIYCIIRNQYDELCAIIFGIAFTVFTYKDKDEFPPSFTINYINYLEGYVVGISSIFYGLVKGFLK